MNKKRGFTLFETIVYMALLALIMTGTLSCVYQLVEAQSKLSVDTTSEEESHFVLRKLAWVLNGTTQIKNPTSTQLTGDTLSVLSNNGISSIIRFNRAQKSIEISTDGGVTYSRLTTSSVPVSGLEFRLTPSQNGMPASIIASTTIANSVISYKTFVSL